MYLFTFKVSFPEMLDNKYNNKYNKKSNNNKKNTKITILQKDTIKFRVRGTPLPIINEMCVLHSE